MDLTRKGAWRLWAARVSSDASRGADRNDSRQNLHREWFFSWRGIWRWSVQSVQRDATEVMMAAPKRPGLFGGLWEGLGAPRGRIPFMNRKIDGKGGHEEVSTGRPRPP